MNWFKNIFFKFSGKKYDPYRQRVEELSKMNPYPFAKWLNGKNKMFFPISLHNIETKGWDAEVNDILYENGYEIVDYQKGLCKNNNKNSKNTPRIGLVLQNILNNLVLIKNKDKSQEKNTGIFSEMTRQIAKVEKALYLYNNSSYRKTANIDKCIVMISQDPHDIATMSTEKGWTSCMELGRGEYHSHVFCEVQYGGLIAYLYILLPQLKNVDNININDIKNYDLEHPIARILIRRFLNVENNNSIAVPEEKIYGVKTLQEFYEIVKEWIDSKQGKIDIGIYNLPEGQYADTSNEFSVVPEAEELDKINKILDAPFKNITKYKVSDELYDDFMEAENSQFLGDPNLGKNIYIKNNTKIFDNKEDALNYIKEKEKEDDKDKNIDIIKNFLKKHINPDKTYESRYELRNIYVDQNVILKDKIIQSVFNRKMKIEDIPTLNKIKHDRDIYEIRDRLPEFLLKYPKTFEMKDFDKMDENLVNENMIGEILLKTDTNKANEIIEKIKENFNNYYAKIKNAIDAFFNNKSEDASEDNYEFIINNFSKLSRNLKILDAYSYGSSIDLFFEYLFSLTTYIYEKMKFSEKDERNEKLLLQIERLTDRTLRTKKQIDKYERTRKQIDKYENIIDNLKFKMARDKIVNDKNKMVTR